ncbi:ATP-dependent helicase [Trichlorobacter ammonificans]|uniref:DNA 3'-5' helicase n=1 Tax=Trichlorobacter ammonificans TaxID=2916410 RepID=A0ABN8HIK6_9BACT|nr:UvrD-helicase domain-containing protein [Trichlorobacter ammonificans]CAH2031148.1 ATP-dependent DNA helicase PcrA [Trichlorobacter ammonificans]
MTSLNPEQLAASRHLSGPLLVLAGAGSGKTQVITSRIVNLLKRHRIPAEQILAVTFTNKAAREMQERVKGAAGKLAEGMIISTFHSLGVRILRHDIRRLGYRPNFSIYGESDQSGVIRQAMGDLDLDPKQFNPDLIRWRISLAKNRLLGPDDYPVPQGNPLDAAVKAVYPRYQQLLRAYNAIDFDDIILLAVHLLEHHPEAADHWQQRFCQIMVDEYQDTNAGQFRLMSLLAERHGNLCVVGDDDQAIYGWRGADVANILSFAQHRPGCTVVKLEQNYRSTGTILAAANAVIGNNRLRSDKALWTASGNGDPIGLLVAEDDEEEARLVVEQLQLAQYCSKRPWRDFAILYRSNTQSRAFEEALRMEGIPYVLVGGQRFFERKEVKDTLSYLTVLNNPRDEAALVRIINFPRRGIGDTTLMRLQQWALEHNRSLHEAIHRVHDIAGISEAARTAVATFSRMLDEEIAGFKPVEMGRQAAALFRSLGINEEMYRTQADAAQARKRIENIEQVVNALSAFEERTPGATLGSFLERISLLEDNRRETDDGKQQDAVTLMSLHASKGLEFPHVFLVGVEEGLLPHHRSADEDPEVAEERRLCYVGITRARERLVLSRCRTRRKYGVREERQPSRFLAEIPEQLLEGASTGEAAAPSADLGADFFARMLAEEE